KRQVGVCNLGDERDLNTAAILLYGKILLQGSIAEVAHTAPEIELKGGYADLRGIGFDVWKRAIIFRTIETALGVYRRQTLRPLDSVERAGALHVERSHAQVAVVLQSPLNKRLQPRITEELPPTDVRGRLSPTRGDWPLRWRLWICFRHGRLKSATTGQNKCGHSGRRHKESF